jgi:hypothetical protein
VQWPDSRELQAIILAPCAELFDRGHVRGTRVFIANGSGEEFEEVFAGFIARSRDDRRDRKFRRKHGGEDFLAQASSQTTC